MTSLTRKDVIRTMAQCWIINDEALLNAVRALPTGRISQLVEIIRSKEDEDQQGEAMP